MRGRFGRHLKLENWPSFVAEILIVVIGIAIALKVDDWNNERLERVEEQRYLVQLQQDFGQTIFRTQGAFNRAKLNIEAADEVLRQLQNCSLETSDESQFAFSLFQLGQLVGEQFVRSTILELRSSGRLAIIQNQDLRILLSASVEGAEASQAIYDEAAREIRASALYLQEATHIMFGADTIDRFGPPSVESVDYSFEELCRDENLTAAIIAIKNKTIMYAQFINARTKFYQSMQGLIEETLDEIDANWRETAAPPTQS